MWQDHFLTDDLAYIQQEFSAIDDEDKASHASTLYATACRHFHHAATILTALAGQSNDENVCLNFCLLFLKSWGLRCSVVLSSWQLFSMFGRCHRWFVSAKPTVSSCDFWLEDTAEKEHPYLNLTLQFIRIYPSLKSPNSLGLDTIKWHIHNPSFLQSIVLTYLLVEW